MNASVHLLRRGIATTVHVRATVPPDHPSAAVLGPERMGTGVIVGSSGLVLTAHYVAIGAAEVEVTLQDATTHSGTVLGVDFESGLAVVGIGAPASSDLLIRPIDEVVVGEDVFMVASTGDGCRANSGVVSAVQQFDAFWEFVIEPGLTVTAHNPGLGGAPLFDRFGRLVGLVLLAMAEIGKLAVAVPASAATEMLQALGRSGRFERPNPRAWLGLTCHPLRHHVVVAGALPGSPVEGSDLQAGDVVLALDGERVSDRAGLYRGIWKHRAGEVVSLKVMREQEVFDVEVRSSAIEHHMR